MTYKKYKILLNVIADFVQLGADNVWNIFNWQETTLNKADSSHYVKASILKPTIDWTKYDEISPLSGTTGVALQLTDGKIKKFHDISQTNFIEKYPDITIEPGKIFDVNNDILTSYYHKYHNFTYENIKTIAETWRIILEYEKSEPSEEKINKAIINLIKPSVLYVLHKYFCTGWAKTVKLQDLYEQVNALAFTDVVDEKHNLETFKSIIFDRIFPIVLTNVANIEKNIQDTDNEISEFYLRNLFYNGTLERNVIAIIQNYNIFALLPYISDKTKLLNTLKNDNFNLTTSHTIEKYHNAKKLIQTYTLKATKYENIVGYNDDSLWRIGAKPVEYEMVFNSKFSTVPKPTTNTVNPIVVENVPIVQNVTVQKTQDVQPKTKAQPTSEKTSAKSVKPPVKPKKQPSTKSANVNIKQLTTLFNKIANS